MEIPEGASAAQSAALPAPPPVPTGGAQVRVEGNLDLIQPGELIGSVIVAATPTEIHLQGALVDVDVAGTGFTYVNNQLVGGTAMFVSYIVNSATQNLLLFDVYGANFPAASLGFWVAANAGQDALSTILAGSDVMTGSSPSALAGLIGADLIRGFGGNDLITGMGGPDTLLGGAGDDQIYAVARPPASGVAGSSSTYLRGDEGNDYVVGGAGFDDINGNVGDDVCAGGLGDDWVVGGKDNDNLSGEAGGDVVWGNLGNDTCDGGDGNDQVRGGQGDDSVSGGAGDDFVSGDRGNDTVSGGAGADLFHGSQDAGIDRVIDFSVVQGDRVFLDPGTTYTVSQVGADTVIDKGAVNQMILVGVTAASLPVGWIFLG